MNQSLLLFLLLLLFLPLAFFLLLRFLRSPRPAVVPFKGRHVLVTGGSSGIGLEIARLSLLEGASSVSILARDRSRLSEAKASIEKSTGKENGILIFAFLLSTPLLPLLLCFEYVEPLREIC